MIQGINSSKTAVFVWLFVFIFLFVGLCVTFTMINNNSLEEDKATPEQMNYLYIGSFLFSCLPIGWTARRRMFAKYIHVPTEDIEVFETNLVVALFRLGKCTVIAAIDLALFAFYSIVSVVIGPFVNIYSFISGIVFMCTKRI